MSEGLKLANYFLILLATNATFERSYSAMKHIYKKLLSETPELRIG